MVRPSHDHHQSWLGRFYLHKYFIRSLATTHINSRKRRSFVCCLFDRCAAASIAFARATWAGVGAKIAWPRPRNAPSQILRENPRSLNAFWPLQLADPEGWYKGLREGALMIMKRTIMRSVLCLAVGCFLIAVDVAALAKSPPGNLSPRDFDLACAVAAGAEIGASQNEQNIPRRDAAVTIFVFYLGRLSGRDDSKDWNAIAWGRVAELQQEARSSQMLDRCLNLYDSKTK
jgi:hypothetical protein